VLTSGFHELGQRWLARSCPEYASVIIAPVHSSPSKRYTPDFALVRIGEP
jgi:hypothetical protein